MTPNNINVTTPSSERELTDNELQAVQGGILGLVFGACVLVVAATQAVVTTVFTRGAKP